MIGLILDTQENLMIKVLQPVREVIELSNEVEKCLDIEYFMDDRVSRKLVIIEVVNIYDRVSAAIVKGQLRTKQQKFVQSTTLADPSLIQN